MVSIKILLAAYAWQGGTSTFCAKTLRRMGHKVMIVSPPRGVEDWLRQRKIPPHLTWFIPMKNWLKKVIWKEYNRRLIDSARTFKPDIYFTINESFTFPETIALIKREINCPTICWVADFPFDSRRFSCLPVSLEYFTHIFVGEPLWIPLIRRIAKPAMIEVLHGAVDPTVFKSVNVPEEIRKKYASPVAFVGDGYGALAEGLYRGRILEDVVNLGLKVWGPAWDEYYQYMPKLRKACQGEVTTFEQTNIINQVSKIVLNIPNPQCLTAMQQRTFEIAASDGFQLADKRSEIDALLGKNIIIQFANRTQLREMVRYYLDNPEERQILSSKARQIVLSAHTYEHRMGTMLEYISQNA